MSGHYIAPKDTTVYDVLEEFEAAGFTIMNRRRTWND